jgi:hypothetical protein
MAHINNTKRPPQFDGTNYGYWKTKMPTHIKSINKKIWQVVENKFEVVNPAQPTAVKEEKLQNNASWGQNRGKHLFDRCQ